MRAYASEFVATFVLVFAGTGAMVVNTLSPGAISDVGVALCFGLAVMVMIYAVGDISGAHINPAVSLGFWLSGVLPARRLGAYVLAQCGGAVVASVFLALLVPADKTLGATLPTIGVAKTLAVEVVITFLLMFVILNITSGGRRSNRMAGLAIGATVALCSLFAGPMTGASMNPARSLGPAVASGQWAHLWIYFVAPCAGAVLAVLACRCTRTANACCCRRVEQAAESTGV